MNSRNTFFTNLDRWTCLCLAMLVTLSGCKSMDMQERRTNLVHGGNHTQKNITQGSPRPPEGMPEEPTSSDPQGLDASEEVSNGKPGSKQPTDTTPIKPGPEEQPSTPAQSPTTVQVPKGGKGDSPTDPNDRPPDQANPNANCYTIDFETDAQSTPLSGGTIVTDQFIPIHVSMSAKNARCIYTYSEVNTRSFALTGKFQPPEDCKDNHQAILFDSASPTGEDDDLRTPSEGAHNTRAQGNVLIIAENTTDQDGDGLVDVPDDEAEGGEIIIDFDIPVYAHSLKLIDIDNRDTRIELIEASGALRTIDITQSTSNSVQKVTLSPERLTSKIIVYLAGDGALDDLTYCLAN